MKKKYQQREYSILLIPKGKVYTQLSSIINKLSNKYYTPRFEPHVTLIGEFDEEEQDIISKTQELSQNLKPYNIRINNPTYFHEYYKSLFLKSKKTKQVMNAHLIAKKIFKDKRDYEYLPHLSLMYGNSSLKIKNQIMSQIKNLDLEFKVKTIHLFSTANGPKNWYKIKEFELK